MTIPADLGDIDVEIAETAASTADDTARRTKEKLKEADAETDEAVGECNGAASVFLAIGPALARTPRDFGAGGRASG